MNGEYGPTYAEFLGEKARSASDDAMRLGIGALTLGFGLPPLTNVPTMESFGLPAPVQLSPELLAAQQNALDGAEAYREMLMTPAQPRHLSQEAARAVLVGAF